MTMPSIHFRTHRKDCCGFTLVELLVTLSIIAILAGISIPNVIRYRTLAEYSALMANVDVLMDAEEAYLLANDTFYPTSGRIRVNSGRAKQIPELGYNFLDGHKHRYIIRGINRTNRRGTRNYIYIRVDSDIDFNGNGKNDRLYFATDIRNGEMLQHREFWRNR